MQVKQQWYTGYRAARATERHDAATYKANKQWSTNAMRLSPDKDSQLCEREAYERGWRMYHDGYRFSDNPYPG